MISFPFYIFLSIDFSPVQLLLTKMTTSQSTIRHNTSILHPPMSQFFNQINNSYIKYLSSESLSNREKSEQFMSIYSNKNNNQQRPIYNGHYVRVKPKPLIKPRLIIYSPSVAESLGLSPSDIQSDEFLQYISGGSIFDDDTYKLPTWATPYSLSILGKRYTSNCPFNTGDGYGDGRALSIGEIFHNQKRHELQLKGAGPTPFCRGADGRAVLRSSIREFLASEAMANLGVPTTRALSLVVTQDINNYSTRPWYSSQVSPWMNNPLSVNPDILVQEVNAITCRVSPSFLRIGHVDLLARRVDKQLNEGISISNVQKSTEFKEFRSFLVYSLNRDFNNSLVEETINTSSIEKFLHQSIEKISTMVSHWMRIGFSQGNLNADNCLLAGRTMDYGPFGYMEEYHPYFSKWTGSGEHYGFINQPMASLENYRVLVESSMVMWKFLDMDASPHDLQNIQEDFIKYAFNLMSEKITQVYRIKLGFSWNDVRGDYVWKELQRLFSKYSIDWTIFWRQLYLIQKNYPITKEGHESYSVSSLMEILLSISQPNSSPFYDPPNETTKKEFSSWLNTWRHSLKTSLKCLPDVHGHNVTNQMRLANPKYILREWMLVDAYTKANPIRKQTNTLKTTLEKNDESMIHELYQLILNPYDEGTKEQEEKYYRRTPEEARFQGGTAHMS